MTAPRLGLASGSSSIRDLGGADNGEGLLGVGDDGLGEGSALKNDWDISKMSEDRFCGFDVVSPRCMSSHFLPTLPFLPILFKPDTEAFEDDGVSIDRLCRLADAEVSAFDDGRESASFDRLRRLACGDRGEFSWTASASACGFSSEIGDGNEPSHSSSTGSSSESEDNKDDAEDCDNR